MKPDVLSVFSKELLMIEHSSILDFVTTAFDRLCPDYFWTIPASIRGHHPPICRQRGGLVHHTKLATAFADQLLDAADIEDTDLRYSQTIAAVLLHDMLKRGSNEDELVTFPDHRVANKSHGRYCAFRLFLHITPTSEIEPVLRAIELHMGRWTLDIDADALETLRTDEVVRITHLADYMASRALHQLLAERHTDPTMRYLDE